ncbi:67 kDa myosin-cross-reactive antigen family protein [Aspergillus floccosus]
MDKQMSRVITALKGLPIQGLLATLWKIPARRAAVAAALVATYLAACASLRFQRLRSIHKAYPQYATREGMAQMTAHDAWAIQKRILQLEFPSISLKALQFALFRTYGIPTISSLLLRTSQFSNPATSFKRYADTGALIGQFMSFDPSSERAITSIARTKFLHTGYRASGKILEADMLYTLSLFAIEPIRFVQMFEWRSMSDLEKCAIGTYWKRLGDGLGINIDDLPSGKTGFRDGLHFLEELTAWSHKYEEEHMKPSAANKEVADKTMDVLVYAMPKPLKPVGIKFASCMMDERLRTAMMYDEPPRTYRVIFSALLKARRFYLRHLSLPRPYFLRQDVFMDEPNEHGRYYIRLWEGLPYYVKPTFWNRWGPGAWFSRLVGLPVPGDDGDKYYPHGYDTQDLGPKYFEGKGRKTMQEIKDELAWEAGVPPSRVHILEKLSMAGGGTISYGDATNGYDFRAGGMPQFNDVCMEHLLSLVPSTTRHGRTVLDDIVAYNEENPLREACHTRFLSHKSYGLSRTDPKKVNLGLRDRVDLFMLTSKTEKSLGRTRINEYFSENFFKSYYWLMLATTFGFQPWHSAAELRRFISRFMHDIHDLNRPRRLDRGRYNRHEAIIAPIAQFLISSGADFQFNTTVTDIITQCTSSSSTCRITEIHTTKDDNPEHVINLKPDDIVVVSLGSVMSGAATGTNITPPSIEFMEVDKDLDENWLLWLELSTKDARFGNAYNFCTRMSESRIASFTITLKNQDFFNRFVQLTGDKPGTGSLVTIKDSRWLITLKIPQQPLFPNQPKDVYVLWGYALYPEHNGNFVNKSMINCSGEEVFTEILHQLQFPVEKILRDSITIPCLVPRGTATLLPRACGNRPPIIPERMENIALIGQFVDIPDEPVVTQDYMVRGAQIAINELMGLNQSIKKGKKHPAIHLMGLL